jgi:8-oxo-dGTP pyrophosphatase MutT (NUDIX family)
LAVVEIDQGRYLPGGGLGPGEDAVAAIRREALEECGLRLKLGEASTRATEIVYSPAEGVCFEKRSTFVQAAVQSSTTPSEKGYRLLWLSVPEALTTLSHASHRWAVDCLVGDSR